MSDRVKAQLAAWAIGVLTMVALSAAGFALKECHIMNAEQCRQGQEVRDMRELLKEMRVDVKELLRRQPPNGGTR
jgi:hypothetical protein